MRQKHAIECYCMLINVVRSKYCGNKQMANLGPASSYGGGKEARIKTEPFLCLNAISALFRIGLVRFAR